MPESTNPTHEEMSTFLSAVADNLRSIENHPQGKAAAHPSPAIYHLASFVSTAHSMLEPLMVRPGNTTAEIRAQKDAYTDVIGRTKMAEMMVTTPKGSMIATMMTGASISFDYGDKIKRTAHAATQAIPGNRTSSSTST
ncbi:MAG: hypothetical protein M1814_005837 [Vezdaea aestivalis]|nr:MAG: hypothetical protein M1814_005837 [Vezdaea aestivalis]